MATEPGSAQDTGWEQVDLLSFGSPVQPSAPRVSAPQVSAPQPSAPPEIPHRDPLQPPAPTEAFVETSVAVSVEESVEASFEDSVADSVEDSVEASPVLAAVEAPAPTPAGGGLEGQPARLLILDTETTGLDPEQHRCIEVGAILFDLPTRAVLSQVSFLLPCDSNPAQPVNGIDAAVSRQPQPWRDALRCFEAMLAAADVVVAHNAAFDRQWFGHGPLPAIDKPWLCSMEDLRWPPARQLRPNPSVRDLALAHGVPVWAAHRALTDCIYLAQVFERCPELEELVREGLEPRRLYRARLSYEERHKAREAGFRWNERVSGAWSRRLSEREAALLSFPVVAVDDTAQPRRSA